MLSRNLSTAIIGLVALLVGTPRAVAQVNGSCCGQWVTLSETGFGYNRSWSCERDLHTSRGVTQALVCSQLRAEDNVCPALQPVCAACQEGEQQIHTSGMAQQLQYASEMLQVFQFFPAMQVGASGLAQAFGGLPAPQVLCAAAKAVPCENDTRLMKTGDKAILDEYKGWLRDSLGGASAESEKAKIDAARCIPYQIMAHLRKLAAFRQSPNGIPTGSSVCTDLAHDTRAWVVSMGVTLGASAIALAADQMCKGPILER